MASDRLVTAVETVRKLLELKLARLWEEGNYIVDNEVQPPQDGYPAYAWVISIPT